MPLANFQRALSGLLLCALVAVAAPASSATLDEELALTANELNAVLPKMIDETTRWDEVIAGPGPRFEYVYTLTDHWVAEETREKMLVALRPALRDTSCGNSAMNWFWRFGVDVFYTYRTSNDHWRRSVRINLLDCAGDRASE